MYGFIYKDFPVHTHSLKDYLEFFMFIVEEGPNSMNNERASFIQAHSAARSTIRDTGIKMSKPRQRYTCIVYQRGLGASNLV